MQKQIKNCYYLIKTYSDNDENNWNISSIKNDINLTSSVGFNGCDFIKCTDLLYKRLFSHVKDKINFKLYRTYWKKKKSKALWSLFKKQLFFTKIFIF